MKKMRLILSLTFLFTSKIILAQTSMKELKIGHSFNISIPNYMSRTVGLNDAASIQFKSAVKDVYGFVIEDNKEELSLAELEYSSINEFTDSFAKTFLKDQKNKKIEKPIFVKKGEINYAEFDATYFDEESQIEIYYLIGIVETKTSYYKVLSWSAASEKENFKEDFRKILYSLSD